MYSSFPGFHQMQPTSMSDESKVKKHVQDLSTGLYPMKTEEDMYMYVHVCMYMSDGIFNLTLATLLCQNIQSFCRW